MYILVEYWYWGYVIVISYIKITYMYGILLIILLSQCTILSCTALFLLQTLAWYYQSVQNWHVFSQLRHIVVCCFTAINDIVFKLWLRIVAEMKWICSHTKHFLSFLRLDHLYKCEQFIWLFTNQLRACGQRKLIYKVLHSDTAPTEPRWAPCWPHEPCYLGYHRWGIPDLSGANELKCFCLY